MPLAANVTTKRTNKTQNSVSESLPSDKHATIAAPLSISVANPTTSFHI